MQTYELVSIAGNKFVYIKGDKVAKKKVAETVEALTPEDAAKMWLQPEADECVVRVSSSGSPCFGNMGPYSTGVSFAAVLEDGSKMEYHFVLIKVWR